jgi:hypothetical protein
MLNSLRSEFVEYINAFTYYDYIAYTWLIVLFIFLLVVAIALRERVGVSIFLIILSIFVLFVGPIILKKALDIYVRGNEVVIKSQNRLRFSDTLVISGEFINKSRVKIKSCKLSAKVYKIGKNRLKTFVNRLKPYKKKTISLDMDKMFDNKIEFRVVFDNFKLKGDFNISSSATCY